MTRNLGLRKLPCYCCWEPGEEYGNNPLEGLCIIKLESWECLLLFRDKQSWRCLQSVQRNNVKYCILSTKKMLKQKKYDWKDSNLALFGSDTEKKVRKPNLLLLFCVLDG